MDKLELYDLGEDIHVFYKTAKSFPGDALATHQALHALVPYTTERRYFGFSRPEPEFNGEIVYRAAAEELNPGEGKALGCDSFIIPKGSYVSTILKDFTQYGQDTGIVLGNTFDALIHSGYQIDPEGYCIEWYLEDGRDVRCMIRVI